MSIRLVSATDWMSARSAINTLLTNFNAVHIASTSGSISPSIVLENAVGLIGRTMAGGDLVQDNEYSDADGIVYKYNLLRKYDSCRRRDTGGSWHYGHTVSSAGLIGHRSGSFPSGTPDVITPPAPGELIRNYVLTNDILEIIIAGCPIHSSTVFVGAGSEYVVIDECHSSCHSSCHGDCRRGKR